LVAACQVLFSRWSGQEDVAVGTVTSGRDRAELERLVGFFVNTLVLRSTVRGDRTVGDFLDDVRGTVQDAFAHQDVPFEPLLDEITGDPDRTLADLPTLTAAERRQVLVEWNDTARPVPAGTVPGLFAVQARRTPDATAVACGAAGLTYRELAERSDRLAAHLIRLGVRAEDRVGLLMGRSVEQVVAILAVLKAGGAYL